MMFVLSLRNFSSMEDVPSLNVKAFIAAYERYIGTQEDLLVISQHLFACGDDNSLDKMLNMLKCEMGKHRSLKIQKELLPRDADGRFRGTILKSKFDDKWSPSGILLNAQYEKWNMNFSECTEGQNVYVSSDCNVYYNISGTLNKHIIKKNTVDGQFRCIDDPFPDNLYSFIIFLWQYTLEQHSGLFTEGDEINYDALRDIIC